MPYRFVPQVKDLESFLEPVFAAWKLNRKPSEALGDFVARTGFAKLRTLAAAGGAGSNGHAAAANGGNGNGNGNGKPALNLDDATYQALSALAQQQGKTVQQLAGEALQQQLLKK